MSYEKLKQMLNSVDITIDNADEFILLKKRRQLEIVQKILMGMYIYRLSLFEDMGICDRMEAFNILYNAIGDYDLEKDRIIKKDRDLFTLLFFMLVDINSGEYKLKGYDGNKENFYKKYRMILNEKKQVIKQKEEEEEEEIHIEESLSRVIGIL